MVSRIKINLILIVVYPCLINHTSGVRRRLRSVQWLVVQGVALSALLVLHVLEAFMKIAKAAGLRYQFDKIMNE